MKYIYIDKILIFILIFIFLARYVILKFYPDIIFNAYIILFVTILLTIYFFTKSIMYSIIISLIILIGRYVHRQNTDIKILTNYNSVNNMIVMAFGLIFVYFFIIFFNNHNKELFRLLK